MPAMKPAMKPATQKPAGKSASDIQKCKDKALSTLNTYLGQNEGNLKECSRQCDITQEKEQSNAWSDYSGMIKDCEITYK